MKPWTRDASARDVALRVDQGVEMFAGGQVVDQFERGDLDDAVAVQRFKASGLGVEQDAADHARSVWMKRVRIRKV